MQRTGFAQCEDCGTLFEDRHSREVRCAACQRDYDEYCDWEAQSEAEAEQANARFWEEGSDNEQMQRYAEDMYRWKGLI